MNVVYIVVFILIDMIALLLMYRYFGKYGLQCMYILHIILSQLTINIPIKIFGVTTVIGSILYAVLFLTMDIINEHYGKEEAGYTVNIGVCILIIFMIIITFINKIISSNEDDYSIMFKGLFKNQLRIVISDIIVSYFIFQRLNIWIFNKIKKITKEKYLWLRNNVSTMLSQIFTAIFFYEFAFAGVINQKELWQIIIAGLVIKLIITLFETPFLYISNKVKKYDRIGDS